MKPIFAVAIDDKVLISSPLQRISALVNRKAAIMIRDSVLLNQEPHAKISALCLALNSRSFETPEPRTGSLQDPLFLGLFPVRGHATGCVFADCTTGVEVETVMSLETAKRALNAYFDLIAQAGQHQADIRIFGGEDFPALDVLFFTEAYARQRAVQANLSIQLSLISGGHFPLKIVRWVGDHFDTVTLCLDGLHGTGDEETSGEFEQSVSSIVKNNARVLSESPADLTLRVCITKQAVQRMSDIAQWIMSSFIPYAVSFQTWLPKSGWREDLDGPDPVGFARVFNQAAELLEAHGIIALYNPADIRTARITACPVGMDGLTITPEGRIAACTLPASVWQGKSLPFQIGRVTSSEFKIDPVALNDTRALTVLKAPVCENCISLFHCAGGCYVHNPRQKDSEGFSDRCLQIRLVTISNLLRAMGQFEASREWLDHHEPSAQGRRVVKDRLRDLK